MVTVNGTPVVYKSRLQKSVALSSAEAEYIAMSMCVQEILWVKQILLELGHPFERPIQLFVIIRAQLQSQQLTDITVEQNISTSDITLYVST